MSHSNRTIIAIAFHSCYGHTAVVAEAVARGAARAGAEVVSISVNTVTDEQWAQLDVADAITFGAATYMGTASAGFTNSGAKSGDKSSTLGYFATLAAQHGMHWISLGLMPGRDSTTGSEDDIDRLGFFMGAGAQSPTDAGPEAVHTSDIATAEHLGARVARQAAVFRAGRAALAA
ncbi:flavodoxin domain-containing protein [Streptomyces canus]|uniref:flavodoxin domain-containing protein n=1 Tax=Streptomyces canus TaxID=58343 RepID=UPI0036C0ECCE